MEQTHEQQGNDHTDQQQRKFQRRHRWTGHEEKRRGDPRLHRENVVLAVQEQRKGNALDEVLRHQSHHRLIGIEIGLRPEDEYRGAGDDEHDDRGGDERALAMLPGGSPYL